MNKTYLTIAVCFLFSQAYAEKPEDCLRTEYSPACGLMLVSAGDSAVKPIYKSVKNEKRAELIPLLGQIKSKKSAEALFDLLDNDELVPLYPAIAQALSGNVPEGTKKDLGKMLSSKHQPQRLYAAAVLLRAGATDLKEKFFTELEATAESNYFLRETAAKTSDTRAARYIEPFASSREDACLLFSLNASLAEQSGQGNRMEMITRALFQPPSGPDDHGKDCAADIVARETGTPAPKEGVYDIMPGYCRLAQDGTALKYFPCPDKCRAETSYDGRKLFMKCEEPAGENQRDVWRIYGSSGEYVLGRDFIWLTAQDRERPSFIIWRWPPVISMDGHAAAIIEQEFRSGEKLWDAPLNSRLFLIDTGTGKELFSVSLRLDLGLTGPRAVYISPDGRYGYVKDAEKVTFFNSVSGAMKLFFEKVQKAAPNAPETLFLIGGEQIDDNGTGSVSVEKYHKDMLGNVLSTEYEAIKFSLQ